MDVHHDFEDDLQQLSRVEFDYDFAQEVYAALCNMRWRNIEDPTKIYFCSWRYAGKLIAEMRGNYDVMNYCDFHCSGNEGTVTEEVKNELRELGWEPLLWEEE